MTDPRGRGRFRSDIEALRAVAIVLVVVFHMGVTRFAGGFIGVDVFFVLSGFLITTQIVADRQQGAFGFGRFWANRVRRLVPALALMVGVTVIAAAVALPVIYLPGVLQAGTASLFYVSNVLFARHATDYFASSLDPDLFRHTWSLAVEEQFYLVWPLLLSGLWLGTRRIGAARDAIIAVALSVVGVSSLLLAVTLTADGSPWSFYGLPSRAWEFAVGGFLAVAGWQLRWMRSTVALAGLATIVGAALVFDDTTAHPGWPTVVPVLATAAVIVARCDERSILGRAMAAPPVQQVGRLSYSWYLWHWPCIILAVEVLDASFQVRLAGAIIGLAIAVVTNRLVEEPIRFNPRLQRSSLRTFAVGGAITVVALGVVGLVVRYERTEIKEPFNAMLREARTGNVDMVGDFCQDGTTPYGSGYCELGAKDGPTVLLLGDSHAGHWIPALDGAGRAEGIRVITRILPGCPSLVRPLEGSGYDTSPAKCSAFQEASAELIEELHPDAIVHANLGSLRNLVGGTGVSDEDAAEAAWTKAVQQAAAQADAAGARFGVILDNPRSPNDPIRCLADGGSNDSCSASLTEALAPVERARAAETAVVEALASGEALDTVPLLCDAQRCPVIAEGQVVYFDRNHITAGFSQHLAPAFTPFLRSMVDG